MKLLIQITGAVNTASVIHRCSLVTY